MIRIQDISPRRDVCEEKVSGLRDNWPEDFTTRPDPTAVPYSTEDLVGITGSARVAQAQVLLESSNPEAPHCVVARSEATRRSPRITPLVPSGDCRAALAMTVLRLTSPDAMFMGLQWCQVYLGAGKPARYRPIARRPRGDVLADSFSLPYGD